MTLEPGAPENDEDSGDAANPGGAGGTGVNQLAEGERTHASQVSSAHGGEGAGDQEAPEASSSS